MISPGSVFWANRWNVSQIERDASQDLKVGDLEMKVVQLERMVAYLFIKLYRGERLDTQDRIVREFLHLSSVREDEDSLNAIFSQLVEPLGLLTCPQCGAKIRDVPGVTDERCHWCGALVGSER